MPKVSDEDEDDDEDEHKVKPSALKRNSSSNSDSNSCIMTNKSAIDLMVVKNDTVTHAGTYTKSKHTDPITLTAQVCSNDSTMMKNNDGGGDGDETHKKSSANSFDKDKQELKTR
uniref:Uncharacterized protein n=1 Tax=Lygus hesperus TaxID=30085 RepID=A0A146KQ14_LYGHE